MLLWDQFRRSLNAMPLTSFAARCLWSGFFTVHVRCEFWQSQLWIQLAMLHPALRRPGTAHRNRRDPAPGT
ncbi:hypothetical protein BDW72DRAFT_133315 [Aspergillus terricola var. indicus]